MLFHFLINLEKIFDSSPILGLGVSILGGIVVSLSPCIMPLIPITLSIVGATTASSRLKGFLISLIFVLGIATTYTILGATTAFFGVFLGKVFDNLITYSILGILFLIFGLYLVGRNFGITVSASAVVLVIFYMIFCGNKKLILLALLILLGFIISQNIKLNFLSFSYNYSPKATKISIFILGLISGLAIVPCNFPVLGAILSIIYFKKDVLYGASALFLFSLGYGVILIALGTFTSLLNKLPKQGFGLIIIRKSLGLILIFMGAYFVSRFIRLMP
jgi:thiol:disulfide interchange protein DsbD